MTISSLSLRPAVTPVVPALSLRGVEAPTAAVTALEPAVRVEIRGDAPARTGRDPDERSDSKTAAPAAEEPRIIIDKDTKAVVYQVLDPGSGDVVFQLPDPVVLKARGYAEAAQARSTEAAEHALDRTP